MPYISTKTSAPISAEKEAVLKQKLGKAIECIPGKDESWLMLSFEDCAHLWFQGKNDRLYAMVEVKIFGSADKKYYQAMTETVTDILNEELNIPKDCIYIKYDEEYHWGWNGRNF